MEWGNILYIIHTHNTYKLYTIKYNLCMRFNYVQGLHFNGPVTKSK